MQSTPKPSDFLRGFALPFRCVLLCWTHKALRRHSLLAALLTALVLLGCAIAAWFLSLYLSNILIHTLLGAGASVWKSIAHTSLRLLVWGGLFVLGSISIPPILLSSLQDKLSETTEQALHPLKPEGSWLKSSWNGLCQTLLRVLFLCSGAFALFVLSFLPAIGFAFAILSILWASVCLGFEHISTPLARNNGSFLTGLRLLKKRKALFLGFGFGTYVLLWLPILQFFLISGATVGGTLLYLAVQNEFPGPQKQPLR
jgi:uncharacterized protein involved in cysteine biosynthesis